MVICQYVLKAIKMDVKNLWSGKSTNNNKNEHLLSIYLDTGIFLSNLHVLTHLILTTCYYPHIQIRKLRPRVTQNLAWIHMASERESWAGNLEV